MEIKAHPVSPAQSLNKLRANSLELNRSEVSVNQSLTGDSQARDKLTLTETASLLSRVLQSSAKVSVVDTERVNEIRRSIMDGSHKIDSTSVAKKLIQFESNL